VAALQANSRIQEVETLARGKVSQDFHKRTVERLEQQLKAVSAEKAQASTEVRRLAEELREVTTRAEEAAKAVSHTACPGVEWGEQTFSTPF